MKTQEHFKQLDNIRKKDGLLEAGLYDFKKTLKRHPHAKTAALAGLAAVAFGCGGGGTTGDVVDPIPDPEPIPETVSVYRVEQTGWNLEYIPDALLELTNTHPTDGFNDNIGYRDFLTQSEAEAYRTANLPGPAPVDPWITVWDCEGDNPTSWQIRQSVYDTNPSAYNLNPVPCGSG